MFTIKIKNRCVVLDQHYNSKFLINFQNNFSTENYIIHLENFQDGLNFLKKEWIDDQLIISIKNELNNLSLKEISDYIEIVHFFQFSQNIVNAIIDHIYYIIQKNNDFSDLRLNFSLIKLLDEKMSNYHKVKLYNSKVLKNYIPAKLNCNQYNLTIKNFA